MISGLNHVGIGVTDLESSLPFYKEILGFSITLLDVSCIDPSMHQVIGRSVRIRTVLLENAVGGSAIKLAQLLPIHQGWLGQRARPISTDRRWGDPGYLEVAVEVSDLKRTYAELKSRSLEFLLSPQHWHIPGILDGTYFYIKDPDGVFVEVIEGGRKKRFADYSGIYAINHVAVGVTNMERSLEFYCGILGFEVVIDVRGTFPGEEKVVGSNIELRIVMLGHPNGGGRVELVEILPPIQPKPIPPERRWGDIGVMEAALEVKDIKRVSKDLLSKGVQFLCAISSIPETQIRYVFIADPDDNEVGLYEFP